MIFSTKKHTSSRRSEDGSKVHPPTRRAASPKGFTLIETMVSSALLIMAVTGVVSAFAGVSRSFEHERHLTHAMALGESQIESLLQRYQSHVDLTTAAHPTLYFDKAGQKQVSPSTYAVDWTVQPTTFGMRRVKVTVGWNEGAAATPASISFQTLRK